MIGQPRRRCSRSRCGWNGIRIVDSAQGESRLCGERIQPIFQIGHDVTVMPYPMIALAI